MDYCEGGEFVKRCDVSEVIVVDTALYGRMELSDCITLSDSQLGCRLDVLPIMDSVCSGIVVAVRFFYVRSLNMRESKL